MFVNRVLAATILRRRSKPSFCCCAFGRRTKFRAKANFGRVLELRGALRPYLTSWYTRECVEISRRLETCAQHCSLTSGFTIQQLREQRLEAQKRQSEKKQRMRAKRIRSIVNQLAAESGQRGGRQNRRPFNLNRL